MTEKKPKVNSEGQKELEKVKQQFDEFDNQVQTLTLDRMNEAPKKEIDPQTKISQRDMQKVEEVYLKPFRSIGSKEKFNEDYREEYNFAKEYVFIIAENHEVIGETIELWTKPFAGCPAEFWKVPVNKPIHVPRYVAERIKGCSFHVLSMQDRPTSSDGTAQYYGQMVVDTTKQRLDARPANTRKSIFTGAYNF